MRSTGQTRLSPVWFPGKRSVSMKASDKLGVWIPMTCVCCGSTCYPAYAARVQLEMRAGRRVIAPYTDERGWPSYVCLACAALRTDWT